MSQYNCNILECNIKLQRMQATKQNTFLMLLCKDSRACSKPAIPLSCPITTEQQLWHFVPHESPGYKVVKAIAYIWMFKFSYSGVGLIGCISGKEKDSCTKSVAKDYILKTKYWFWFYNTFITFSLLNTDYQGNYLLHYLSMSGQPIVLIASSENITWYFKLICIAKNYHTVNKG